MTNTVSLLLAGTIVGMLIADATWFDSANTLFLAKKLDEFIEWLAFWR